MAPLVENFESEMALYIKSLCEGIKCRSCNQFATPGGKFSQGGLKHLSCGHLSCSTCIEKEKGECPECGVTITPIDVHESAFLETMQKYIQELGSLFKDGMDAVDDPVDDEATQVLEDDVREEGEEDDVREEGEDDVREEEEEEDDVTEEAPTSARESPKKAKGRKRRSDPRDSKDEDTDQGPPSLSKRVSPEHPFKVPKSKTPSKKKTPSKMFSEELVKAGIVSKEAVKGKGKEEGKGKGKEEGKGREKGAVKGKGKEEVEGSSLDLKAGHSKPSSKATNETEASSSPVTVPSSSSPLRVSKRQRKPKIFSDAEYESDSSPNKLGAKSIGKKVGAKCNTKGSESETESKLVSQSSVTSSRSSSLSGHKIGLLGTALKESQKQLLVRFKDTFPSVKVYEDYDERVTHVVGAVEKGTRVTTRTLKYMKGLLGHKWLVGLDWIESSLKEKRVLAEEPFELLGTKKQDSSQHGAPERARLAGIPSTSPSRPKGKKSCDEDAETLSGKLFQGLSFYFSGKFHGKDGLPDLAELKGLVELGGAKVLTVKPGARGGERVLVVVEDERRLEEKTPYKMITVKTLFTMIENYEIN